MCRRRGAVPRLSTPAPLLYVIGGVLLAAGIPECGAYQRTEVAPPGPHDPANHAALFTPDGYNPGRAEGNATAKALVVMLSGYCLWNPKLQDRMQVGFLDHIDDGPKDFLYLTPIAPHRTKECVLCEEVGTHARDATFPVAMDVGVKRLENFAARKQGRGCHAWDAWEVCCRPEAKLERTYGSEAMEDHEYLMDLIEEVITSYDVDASRVYLYGIGNGGFMALRMATEYGNRFGAVISYAGGIDEAPAGLPPPTFSTNVLTIHGTKDMVVPYGGGRNTHGVQWQGAMDTFHSVTTSTGCDPAEADDGEVAVSSTFNLNGKIYKEPERDPLVEVYECRGEKTTTHWRVHGAGHFIQGGMSQELFTRALDYAWNFRADSL